VTGRPTALLWWLLYTGRFCAKCDREIRRLSRAHRDCWQCRPFPVEIEHPEGYGSPPQPPVQPLDPSLPWSGGQPRGFA
jgi:hypothetical protein